MSDSTRTLSRRRMVTGTAGCLAAIGLGAIEAPGSALADTPKKLLKGKLLSEIEAKHPEGSDGPPEVKLDAQSSKLAQLLVHKTRHAFALAAANPTAKFAPGSIHATAASAVAAMSAKRAQRAKTRATAMLAASATDKTASFGPYATASLASATAKQSVDIQLSPVVKEVTLKLKDAQKKSEKEKEKPEPKYTRLMWQLNSVKCITKQDNSAHDEILISGYVIERDGTCVKIDRIKYEGFSSGEKKYLDYEGCAAAPGAKAFLESIGMCPHGSTDDVYRGRKLVESKMGGPGTWVFMLVLGEQDDGGFSGWLSDLYKKLKKEIDELVEQVLKGVGEAVGAALSAYIGPLGEALGVAIGWALGKIYEWITSLIGDPQDDILGAYSWTSQFQERTQSYVKSLVPDRLPSPKDTCASPIKKFSYKSQGGHYEVRWHWRAYET